jgi:hypothetical protein
MVPTIAIIMVLALASKGMASRDMASKGMASRGMGTIMVEILVRATGAISPRLV